MFKKIDINNNFNKKNQNNVSENEDENNIIENNSIKSLNKHHNNFDKFNSNQINPKNLIKDYEDIKLCAINPKLKENLEIEAKESKEILAKINRIIDKY